MASDLSVKYLVRGGLIFAAGLVLFILIVWPGGLIWG